MNITDLKTLDVKNKKEETVYILRTYRFKNGNYNHDSSATKYFLFYKRRFQKDFF